MIEEACEEDLLQFIEKNGTWIEKISRFFLKYKNRKYKHYIQEWLFEAYPLDELGITIWARCYRKHVCIFVNSEFYTTHQNDDITKCGIHLVYRGDKVFEQTRLMTAVEYVAASSAIAQVQAKYDQLSLIAQKDTIYKNYARKKAHKRKSAVLSSDNEEEVDLEQLFEKADSSLILHTMQIRKCQVILTPLESALEDALKKFKAASPTSELSDKEQSEDNHEQTVVESDKNKEKSEDNHKQTVAESDKNKEQSEDNHKQTVAESDKNKEQLEGSTIVLSGDEDNKEKQDSKGTDNTNNLQNDVKESARKEGATTVKTDTATKANNVQKNVKPISSKHQAAKSLMNKAHQSNRQGSWTQVTNFRKAKCHRKSPVKREKRKKVLKTKHCPYKNCKVKEATKKDMVKHINIVHPDFQWRCRYCPKKYGSRAARNKHEILHIHGYRFFCSYKKCTKKFVFKGELEEHERKHTRKNLWPCTFKECDKAYPCK